MSDTLKSVLFAMATAVVCSLLLTAAATGLKERRVLNETVDRQKNILKSVGLLGAVESTDPGSIQTLFDQKISCIHVDAGGRFVEKPGADSDLRPVCLYTEEEELQAYIVPVNVKGLWGGIESYLAIDRDGKTVEGFTVCNHAETPGLGGEIEKPWFQRNFRDKRIVDAAGQFVSITVTKGKVADAVAPGRQDHYVDGISGATLTGRFLSSGMKTVLEGYEPLGRRMRAGADGNQP